MSANSPRVIFSSCPIVLLDFGFIIPISIAFFAYPYQYDVTSGILTERSKFVVLSISSQILARLRSIAAASIRVIVLLAQNGLLVYC